MNILRRTTGIVCPDKTDEVVMLYVGLGRNVANEVGEAVSIADVLDFARDMIADTFPKPVPSHWDREELDKCRALHWFAEHPHSSPRAGGSPHIETIKELFDQGMISARALTPFGVVVYVNARAERLARLRAAFGPHVFSLIDFDLHSPWSDRLECALCAAEGAGDPVVVRA